MTSHAPAFRDDCLTVSSLGQLKEFGLLTDLLDDAVQRSIATSNEFPRTLVRGGPGSGRQLVVDAIGREMVLPVLELNGALRCDPADVIEFLDECSVRGPAIAYLRHAHNLRKEAQELVAKAFVGISAAGSIVQNIDRDMTWAVPMIGDGLSLLATTTEEAELSPSLEAAFQLRFRLRLTPGTIRHRVRRALRACGLQPTRGATILLGAIWCADPGSVLEQVRALVRMCNDARESTVRLPMIATMSHRLLPFIATSDSAMELIAEAMERAQPRAAAADAAQPNDLAAEIVEAHGKAA
jgi:hypothetical protein